MMCSYFAHRPHIETHHWQCPHDKQKPQTSTLWMHSASRAAIDTAVFQLFSHVYMVDKRIPNLLKNQTWRKKLWEANRVILESMIKLLGSLVFFWQRRTCTTPKNSVERRNLLGFYLMQAPAKWHKWARRARLANHALQSLQPSDGAYRRHRVHTYIHGSIPTCIGTTLHSPLTIEVYF